MTTRKRRPRTAALVAATLLIIGGCGGGGGQDPESVADGDEPYNWGINAEQSGFVSYYGTSIADGVKAYVDSVNAAGGINGHEIELTALDNAGEASRAATNATELVTAAGVNAILGHVLSATCSAAEPVVTRSKIPLACLSVAEPSEYLFQLGASNGRGVSALLGAAKEVSGTDSPNAAVLAAGTQTSLAALDGINENAADAGVNLVSTESVDLDATDVSPQIAKIVAADPDVIILSVAGPTLVTILDGVRAGGVQAPIVWLDGTGNFGSLVESTDTNVYAFSVHQLVPTTGATGAAQEFVEAMGSKLDGMTTVGEINSMAVVGYMTARGFGAALEECGYPCSGEELAAEIGNVELSLPGLEENFGFGADNGYPFPNWYLYKVVGPEVTLAGTFAADEPAS